jgi:hypothetical protein
MAPSPKDGHCAPSTNEALQLVRAEVDSATGRQQLRSCFDSWRQFAKRETVAASYLAII